MQDLPTVIRTAVGLLDAENDSHWTKDGLPSVDIVRELSDDPSVTRSDITAACPDVKRETETKAGDDATKEPETDTKATTEEAQQKEPAGSDDTSETQAGDGQSSIEDDQEDGAGDEYLDMNMGEFLVRGLLMAIIMRLPAPMRVMADGVMLADMTDFVFQWPEHEQRMVVVEMMKSICETRIAEIPSAQYKPRVEAAMNVVTGELDHVRNGIAPADDQAAAAERLYKITGHNSGAKPPGYVAPSVHQKETDEQKAAHDRLYGD